MNKKTILIVSILFYFSFAQAESDNTKTSDIFWGSASQVTLENIQFKNVDKESVSRHDFEKRGFVSVPFDYQIPNKGKIDIFYRLIPTQNPTEGAEDKPILVVMNGGPGSPSSTYRSLDYNYVTREGKDAYQYLSKYFHILAIDQRGTGYSAPLDLESATLSAPAIAKYFDADEHAKDHASVINQVISENKPFFILARSYGGHIGFKYLEMSDTVQKPQGFIFASALQPEMDAVELFVKRREKQRTLNLLIAQDSPKTVDFP